MARQIYREVQRMSQTLFAFIFGGTSLLFIIGMIVFHFKENATWNESVTGIVIATVVLFFTGWLFLSLRLEVKIEESRLSYRMPPLINKERFIQRDEIRSYEVVDFKPIAQYGGWGIRFSPTRGKALTISGSTGLKLHLKNGKDLMLGTMKKAEIDKAMARMMENGQDYA